ncbi:MAG: hypothetical protein HOM62_10980 [Rhodospirillaceae bacterium]|nr:hypothetical protein [Rhodospirillaceae bacterium]MBT7157803.1 hypothetical protein [Rhodospirillaceae bacterium]
MTVISARIIQPTIGKTAVALQRARDAADIMARHGAKVRVNKIAAGDGAGSIVVLSAYPDFATTARVFESYQKDPDFQKLLQERELDPAGTMVGPLVARTVYGDISWDDHPVTMHRIYKVEKAKLQDAISILPDIEKLSDDTSGVMAIVPTFGPDMDRLTVVYQFTSITAAGEQIDRIGMSEEFQKLVIKAHGSGTLVSARMVVAI